MKRAALTLLLAGLCTACGTFSEPSGTALRDAMGIQVTPADVGDTPPQVSYSAEVLMARAEGYYADRRFEEAAQEYARFVELHATHPWAPYALFRRGMCNVHQIRSTDREPAFARQARQAFENLIANYPDSAPVPYARDELQNVMETQADYELGVARFYIRTKRPAAALERIGDLRRTYPDTTPAREALFHQGRALEATGDTQGALSAYRRFLADPTSDTLRARAERAVTRLTDG